MASQGPDTSGLSPPAFLGGATAGAPEAEALLPGRRRCGAGVLALTCCVPEHGRDRPAASSP